MFDVFYIGRKPGLFAHEQSADSIEHARQLSRTRYFWIVNYLSDYSGWDWLWEPVPWEANQIHAWPSQWQKDSGTYLVPKEPHTAVNYHSAPAIVRDGVGEYWDNTDEAFDYTWHPDPTDPLYIYQFGTQWQKTGGPRYVVPGATEVKYVTTPRIEKQTVDAHWQIPDSIDDSFDYTWHPDATDEPYIYQFGTQWQKTGGPVYAVPGATTIKYVELPRATKITVDSCWQIPDNIDDTDFDYTWHPDATDEPFIYQFGTQWQKTGGPRYVVPGASQVKYVEFPRISKQTVDPCWETPEDVDDTDFDYTWHPDATDTPYIYQFGTQWQKTGGPRYVVPGATEIKYVDTVRVKKQTVDPNWQVDDPAEFEDFDYTWAPDATDTPYIYQFGTQWQKTGGPRYVVPGATQVKYVPSPRARRVKIDNCWQVPEGTEFGDFDYTWHPDTTDAPYIYQFGTQWQKTGGPEYIVAGATEIKYVEQVKIEARRIADRVFILDHLDGNAERVKDQLKSMFETVKVVRYFDNYLDTLRRIAKSNAEQPGFIWICSSLCDYSNFDFSWHPEQWQTGMLHVFASNEQKFGDTFFMHPGSFNYRSETCQLLEWFDVNYVPDISVPRWPLPVVTHIQDSQVDVIKTTSWKGPLAIFTVDAAFDQQQAPTVPVWRKKTKTIVPLSPGASSVVVPAVSLPDIKTQLYDYEYIDKAFRHLYTDSLLDIVFISNGESNAEQNWNYLQSLVNTKAANRLVRVDGVNGRVAAYRAAAEASNTPWFFAVFAKLEVEPSFDWSWQPDRMQEPKHYIFHAKNPVTGLEYGHMAMIAYNKKLVLENTAPGLDFTLDQAHEVVPILSGTAVYHASAWMCWRTAFRECIKLRHSLPDVENEYRLDVWLNTNLTNDSYGEWSRIGAADAVEYYESVGGDFEQLRYSYDWAWLASYAEKKHGLTPDQ